MTENNRPLVKNAADQEQVEKAGAKENLRRRQEDVDLKSLLSLPEGRRFIWRLLEKCNVFATSYAENSNTVYFNEGKRNIGIELLAEVTRVDAAAFLEMMTQQRKEVEG